MFKVFLFRLVTVGMTHNRQAEETKKENHKNPPKATRSRGDHRIHPKQLALEEITESIHSLSQIIVLSE